MNQLDRLNAELKRLDIKAWDVSIDEGWAPLVLELIYKLIDMGWDKDLHQVKQKFGALRFYIGEGSREMYDLISEYEAKSETICEVCGESGRVSRLSGWIIILCEKHAKELNADTGTNKVSRGL